MSAQKQTRNQRNKRQSSDFRRLSRRFMSGLLRSLFFINRPKRLSKAGFVLPTTALLLLVLTLTVGALSFRTFSRSSSVIALRDQQVIDSAAAPAVDRAKSKLEYLFSKDSRFPGGIPSSDVIASMMLNDGNNGIPQITANDPYKFPDEERVNIGGSSDDDNAWVFPADVDGDGTVEAGELVAYSILMDDENGANALTDDLSDAKANALVTRNGPINTGEAQSGCGTSRAPEAGWQVVSPATLQKNFQVTAFVSNRNSTNRNSTNSTATALEFQQVRQASRGNKWGAWFKYDLELFPGASRDFFWNGAMHTEGNFLIRDKYKARMISSHNSCLYTQDAAEITLAQDGDYRGEVLSAKTGPNDFSGSSSNDGSPRFHLFTTDGNRPDTSSADGRIGTDNDSVTADREDLRNILMDPIQLFTTDTKAHRSDAGWSHDNGWAGRLFSQRKRIYNSPSAVPYLDDTYRADNRYGPKAVYDRNYKIPDGSSVGQAITGVTALTALDANNGIYGLDGYWERRAIGQGLRIIVGQRLELGNAFGWKGAYESTANNRDPLYPPTSNIASEARQRRSLYDNLAAVQSMAVYHHAVNNGTLPLACVASTAHPGTATSIINSRTFESRTVGSATKLDADFFKGKGTNGWEFAFPYTTAADFATAIGPTQPLGKVMRNLATFSGDPLGGAPSFTPDQTSSNTPPHPSPYMRAWGDFSQLRRIFASGTTYTNLSPADQSTLHSAACTVGMLSYALDNEIESSAVTLTSLNSLGVQLEQLIDGVGSGGAGDIDTYIGTNLPSSGGQANNIPVALRGQPVITSGAVSRSAWNDTIDNTDTPSNPNRRAGCSGSNADVYGGTNRYNRVCDAADYYLQFTREDYYRVLLMQNSLGSTLIDRYLQATAFLSKGSQFSRDRALGFKDGSMPTSPLTSNSLPWSTDTGLVGTPVGGAQLITGCDPDVFTESTNANIGLALAFCVDVEKKPKYPALYYLFPYFAHDHNGKNDSGTSGVYINHTQPSAEEYIADPYITLKNTNGTENNYYAVSDADVLAISTVFAPKATDFSDWKLPTTASASALSSPDTQPFTINVGTTGRDVALLDKGIYDGREMMGSRMLDLDISKLSASRVNPADTSSDRWISEVDGIVYAFREDAVREDSIVRAKDSSTSWTNCDTWDEVYTNSNGNSGNGYIVTGLNRNCRLKTIAGAPYLQDPPLMDGTLISTKPIDFYPDPDRRPYGFRLVNGSTLNRSKDVQSGMTFVSDNMVYIKGDFNLHRAYPATLPTPPTPFPAFDPTVANSCSSLIEEFTDKIVANDCTDRTQQASPIDFYDARTQDERNDANFANPEQDQWRPVEIVGDAVGVLSRTFRDGNIEDGFTLARSPSSSGGNGTSSYQNQHRLSDDAAVPSGNWRHIKSGDNTTPILINRNGGVIRSDGTPVPNSSYIQFSDSDANYNDKRGGDLQQATRTIINAVFISGIVPSQAGQTYGGMHNFPRFIEHWINTDLHISGGFFQLNFSTSATAPFDQRAWEPGSDSTVGSPRIRFYGAPNRIWGYDVGLQYAPAGPIARRFVTVGRPRSEFYRELPVDDPYVKNLRCATFNGSQIDPAATCS